MSTGNKRQILISGMNVDKQNRRSIKQKYQMNIPEQRIQYTQDAQTKKTEQSPINFKFKQNNRDIQYQDNQTDQDIIKSMKQKQRIMDQIKRLESIKKQQQKAKIAKLVLKKIKNHKNGTTAQKNIVHNDKKVKSHQNLLQKYNQKKNHNINKQQNKRQKPIIQKPSIKSNQVKQKPKQEVINKQQVIKSAKKTASPSYQNSMNYIKQNQEILTPHRLQYNPNILSRSLIKKNRMSLRDIHSQNNKRQYGYITMKQDSIYFANIQNNKDLVNKIQRQIHDNSQKLPHRFYS